MTKTLTIIRCSVFFYLVVSPPLRAQVLPHGELLNPTPTQVLEAKHRKQVIRNTSTMKVDLVLDREVYLPGEIMRMNVTVQNPGPLSVEILTPFHCSTGGFNLFAVSGSKALALLPEPYGSGDIPEFPPTLLLGGFQTVSGSFSSTDSFAPCSLKLVNELTAPGQYQISYSYGGHSALFRVSEAVYVSSGYTLIQRRFTPIDRHTGSALIDPKTLQPISYPLALRTSVISSEGKYYLIVCEEARTYDGSFHPQAGESFGKDANFFSPFVRVAESVTPIEITKAYTDENEKLYLFWSEQGGESHRAVLGPDRAILEVH
jgi:hypothetical protein